MPEIKYRGDTEEERRESALIHSQMVELVNRHQKIQYLIKELLTLIGPLEKDLQLFAYLEGFLIEIPEEYYQQTQEVQDQPVEEYQMPPAAVPVPVPAPVQAPPPSVVTNPVPPPPAAAKPQRGRLRQVD